MADTTCWLASRWWSRDGQFCVEHGVCWRSLDAVPHLTCMPAGEDVALAPPCERCGGTGRYGDDTAACFACGGTGAA